MITKGRVNSDKIARVAGLLYLIVWATALFAGFVYSSYLVPGDAMTTANHILASERQFRMGFVVDILHQACFLLLAWALYVLFKSVIKYLDLLKVLFVVISVASV